MDIKGPLEDDYKFELITRSTLGEALWVLKQSYFKDEALSKAVRLLDSDEASREISNLLAIIAEDGVSFVVIEKKSGKVVGALINKLQEKVTRSDGRTFMEMYMEKCKHPSARAWIEMMNNSATAVDLFEKLNVDCYLEMFCATVLRDFRYLGLARRTVEYSLNLVETLINGKNVKISLDSEPLSLGPVPRAITAVATSPGTQHIFSKAGFPTAVEISFSSLVFDGVKLDKILGDENKGIKVVYKQL